jgi:RNA-binding protein YlmH
MVLYSTFFLSLFILSSDVVELLAVTVLVRDYILCEILMLGIEKRNLGDVIGQPRPLSLCVAPSIKREMTGYITPTEIQS